MKVITRCGKLIEILCGKYLYNLYPHLIEIVRQILKNKKWIIKCMFLMVYILMFLQKGNKYFTEIAILPWSINTDI